MKIFLVSATWKINYDDYDSFVVVAPDEDTARNMHPDGKTIDEHLDYYRKMSDELSNIRDYHIRPGGDLGGWYNSPEKVKVEYIGEARQDITETYVVCASYNAG